MGTMLRRLMAVMIVLITLPIWFPTKVVFETACRFGEVGMINLKPYRIDTFTFGNRGLGYYSGRRQWEGSTDFLSPCDEYCIKQLNVLYSASNPWAEIRSGNIAIEESWEFRSHGEKLLRHARFWLAPATSDNCLATLIPIVKDEVSTKCIAGKEIPSISAPYVVELNPFTELRQYIEPTEWRPTPTSKQWRWLKVAKHQFQLLHHGEEVARYVWYEWNSMAYFGWAGTCPDESVPSHVKDRVFWNKILQTASTP
jgi:hypothetical protein